MVFDQSHVVPKKKEEHKIRAIGKENVQCGLCIKLCTLKKMEI